MRLGVQREELGRDIYMLNQILHMRYEYYFKQLGNEFNNDELITITLFLSRHNMQ